MIKSVAQSVQDFLNLESAGGLLLMAATALALIAANSPAEGLYNAFLDAPVEVRVGAISVAKPALLWINDGLMVELAQAVGLDASRARAIVGSDEFAVVREREHYWRQRGITAVPTVIVNDTHVIEGAQPPEAFERALRQIARAG